MTVEIRDILAFSDRDVRRFWSKVAIGPVDDCWEWQAARDQRGYGRFGVGHKKVWLAHRFAFTATVEEPGDLEVRHRCDNPPCVNPSHLALGSHAENMKDIVRRGAHWRKGQTHCKRGHEFTPENTRSHTITGSRICRTCARLDYERRRANGG